MLSSELSLGYILSYASLSFSISGDKEGEKLGDMAVVETEPAWTIGDRCDEKKWGNVCLTAGFGITGLALG